MGLKYGFGNRETGKFLLLHRKPPKITAGWKFEKIKKSLGFHKVHGGSGTKEEGRQERGFLTQTPTKGRRKKPVQNCPFVVQKGKWDSTMRKKKEKHFFREMQEELRFQNPRKEKKMVENYPGGRDPRFDRSQIIRGFEEKRKISLLSSSAKGFFFHLYF